ncbi:MAG: hypothetical protein ABI904_01075 [Chloroflexota bacterium]
MNKRDLKNFIYFLLLISFAIIGLLAISYSFVANDYGKLYEHLNLKESKLSIYNFEWLLKIVAIMIGITSWGALRLFVERKFKIKIFRRPAYMFDYTREQPSLLKFMAGKKKTPK